MAALKTKKSNKSNSKFRNFVKNFEPTSKKGLLLLFMVSFALVGGGYAAYQALAATYPPDQFTNYVHYDNFKAVDGASGPIQCRSVAGNTGGYGYLANCMQLRNQGKEGRMGWYSLDKRTFSPKTGWLPYIGHDGNGDTVPKCKNMDYYFSSAGSLQTGYGPTRYGQIYGYNRVSATTWKWQIKWANMNMINGNCYLEGSTWFTANSFDNIRTN